MLDNALRSLEAQQRAVASVATKTSPGTFYLVLWPAGWPAKMVHVGADQGVTLTYFSEQHGASGVIVAGKARLPMEDPNNLFSCAATYWA